jgi:hypothetical protein
MLYQPQPKSHSGTIVALALLLIGAFAAYDYFSLQYVRGAGPDEGNPLTSEASLEDELFSPEQLAMLKKIEDLKLDDAIFNDPIFRTLQDWTVDLGSVKAGRINPFAPLPGMKKETVAPRTTR